MKIMVAICLLLASMALAAEPDPRLAQIQGERAFLNLQVQNANLTFENALLKLEKLEKEEAEIKAKAKTAATKTEEKKGEEK